MINISISNREKILIYILSLVLIIFLYVSFVRDPLANEVSASNYSNSNLFYSTYEEVSRRYENNLLELEKMKDAKEKIDLLHKDFGMYIDTKNLVEENDLELKNITISPINKEKINNLDVFYIQSITRLEGYLPNILHYIEEVEQNDKLFIENISLDRIDKEKLFVEIRLREYTLIEIPYSGIVVKNVEDNGSEESFEEVNSLIDSIYGSEAKSEEKDNNLTKSQENDNYLPSLKPNSNQKNIKDLKTNDISIDAKESEKNDTVDGVGNTVVTAMITEDKVKNYNDFLTLDENVSSVINQSFLNNYLPNWNVNLLLNSNYFDKNYNSLKNNYNVLNNFFMNYDTNELILFIDSKINLSNSPIVITEPSDLIIFEFDSNIGSTITMNCETFSGNILELELKKKNDGWQIGEIRLPIESYEYPLRIISLRCNNGAGDDSGFIKNIATIKQK